MKKLWVFCGALASLLVVAGFGFHIFLNYQAKRVVNQWVKNHPIIVSLAYRSMTVGWFDSKADLKDITLTISELKEKLKIDRIVVHEFIEHHGESTVLSFEVQGFHLKDSHVDLLKNLGFSEMSINIWCICRYSSEKRLLDVELLRVAIDQAAEVTFSMMAGNVDLQHMETVTAQPNRAVGILAGVAIEKAYLKYDDHGLADKVLQMAGKIHGITVGEYKTVLTKYLESVARDEKSNPVKQVFNELIRFVNSPETIQVWISPARPEYLGRLLWIRSPGDLFEILGISVKNA
jgi:hypothetical protein